MPKNFWARCVFLNSLANYCMNYCDDRRKCIQTADEKIKKQTKPRKNILLKKITLIFK